MIKGSIISMACESSVEIDMKAVDFDNWWNEEGCCLLASQKDKCEIAWSNGTYKAEEAIHKQHDEIKRLKARIKHLTNQTNNMPEVMK